MSDLLCGFKYLHPSWMQMFASTRTFILVYGFLGTVQAMGFVYFANTLTTLERRFEIPNFLMGLILCGNELSQILLSLILSYIGGRRNRPRWLGWGILCCSLSCFVLASPHFLYGAGDKAVRLTKEFMDAEVASNTTDADNVYRTKNRLCSLSPNDQNCTLPPLFPLILIFLSQFILGIGNTLYYSLGQSYLDDNVQKTRTPLLLGIALSLRMLGPVFGFILGYKSLQLYIDPRKTPTITSKDPRWLGAWWLGWIILGILMLIFAFLIGMFPKNLKKTETMTPKVSIMDFVTSFKRLIKSKLLVYNTLSMIFYLLGSNGYIIYLSKYIEVIFQKSAAEATIITGPVTLLAMALGFIVSGWIITRFKPNVGRILFWNVIVGVVVMTGSLKNLFLSCPDTSAALPVTMDCNSQCFCDGIPYTPVCSDLTKTYFSPCHAACESWNATEKLYGGCKCGMTIMAPGACKVNCNFGYFAFIITAAFYNFFGASGRVGNTLVNYRCIKKDDKSFAQGFVLMATSMFALIPAPIIFGKIIDSTCLIWAQECGRQGACQLYDQKAFRYYFNSVAMGFTFLGVVFDVLVWRHGRNLSIYSDPEDHEEPKTEHLEMAASDE